MNNDACENYAATEDDEEYTDDDSIDRFTPKDAYHGSNSPMGHYETGE